MVALGGAFAGSSGAALGGMMGGMMAGMTAAGGATSAGGTLATGGTVGTGGATTAGGTAAAGGGTAAGGTSSAGAKTGGTTATGGMTSTGGAKTGGSPATGGAPGTGGIPATGGSTTPANPGAPETKPLGYGQATTGGGTTTPVVADSMAAVQAAIDGYSGSGGLAIKYTGKFDFTSISDPCTQWLLPAQTVEIKKKNDITILGADGSAVHFGFHIASSSSNIIIRNMTIGLLPGAGSSDAISLEGMSGGVPSNIWIDHNELFSSMAVCPGAGDTSFDGLIDIKKGADNVTVSYNYIHDHHKVSLNGYSDDDTAVRHITFHHNVFSNVGSRTPLQRGGYSHVLNNYLTTITASGANIRMGGYSLIEGNYFEKTENPVTSRDSSALGFWELRNNNITTPADFTQYTITWSASTSTPTKDATDWTTTAAYPVALGYTYKADPPQCLKDSLLGVAGAGKGLATLKCN
jgi:pectate lyase